MGYRPPQLFSDSMELTENIRNYWNLRSRGFSESVIYEISTGETEHALGLLESMGVSKGDYILDVGCGPGYFALALAGSGVHVIGIDFSEEMILKARSNACEYGSDARFIVMDAQNMTLPDSSFDHVVSRNVFWNLTRPEDAYSEIFRVLKPGGSAGIMDGNFYLNGREPPAIPEDHGHHSRFNRGEVDFGIIDRLAKDLPLSSNDRPAWDVGVLSRMRECTSVCVSFPKPSDVEGSPPTMFTIVARKVV